MRALWNLGFRPFFLFGGMWSALHVLLWVLFQAGWISLPLQDPMVWHAHEMIFGFASAMVAGFLLTASQNWTGIQGVHGKKLKFLYYFGSVREYFLLQMKICMECMRL